MTAPDLRGIDVYTPTEIHQFVRQGVMNAAARFVLVSDLDAVVARAVRPLHWIRVDEQMPGDDAHPDDVIVTVSRSGSRRFNSLTPEGEWLRGDEAVDEITHWLYFRFPSPPTGTPR